MTNGTATLDRNTNRTDRIGEELALRAPELAKTGLVTTDEVNEATSSVGADLLLRILTAATIRGEVNGARAEAQERGDHISTYLTRLAHLTG